MELRNMTEKRNRENIAREKVDVSLWCQHENLKEKEPDVSAYTLLRAYVFLFVPL
jgi:hypothetical protein